MHYMANVLVITYCSGLFRGQIRILAFAFSLMFRLMYWTHATWWTLLFTSVVNGWKIIALSVDIRRVDDLISSIIINLQPTEHITVSSKMLLVITKLKNLRCTLRRKLLNKTWAFYNLPYIKMKSSWRSEYEFLANVMSVSPAAKFLSKTYGEGSSPCPHSCLISSVCLCVNLWYAHVW